MGKLQDPDYEYDESFESALTNPSSKDEYTGVEKLYFFGVCPLTAIIMLICLYYMYQQGSKQLFSNNRHFFFIILLTQFLQIPFQIADVRLIRNMNNFDNQSQNDLEKGYYRFSGFSQELLNTLSCLYLWVFSLVLRK